MEISKVKEKDKDFAREKKFELAKIAFQDARSEISSRLAMRERVVEIYVVGSITLFSGLLIAIRLGANLPPFAFAASPLLAFVCALLLKAHYVTMERLSQFIIIDLNKEFCALGCFVPTWDTFNRSGTDQTGTKTDQVNWRWAAHIIAIHLPSVLTVLSLGFYVYERNIAQQGNIFDIPIFIVSLVVLLSAILITSGNRRPKIIPVTPSENFD